MPTSYTSLLGLALPVTGELSGTWGATVNDSITSLLDTAVAGTTSITTDADITLTTTTGASNQARQAIILWSPASGTTTRNITAPAQSKIYTVINASGGTQSIVFRGVGPTTGVTIVKGESAVVAWNGSDFIKVSNTSGAGTFTDLTVTGNLGVGTSSPTAKLEVFGGYVISGTASSVNGSKILGGYYTSGHLATFGGEFSSGGPVIGYGVWPSTSASGAFVSATTINVARGAYTIVGDQHVWSGGGAQTVAIDSAVTTSERMRLDASGNLGIGTSSPGSKLQVVGEDQVIRSLRDTGSGGLSANDYGGRIAFGTSAGAGTGYIGGQIGIIADAAWTAGSSQPSSLEFFTVPSGSTTLTSRMRLDASGNLGLGVTPSAWPTTAPALQMQNGSLSSLGGPYGQVNLTSNAYASGSGDIGFTTWRYARGATGDLGAAARYTMTGANHQWFIASSGIAGNAITFTQAMTLDQNGNLLVGATDTTVGSGTGLKLVATSGVAAARMQIGDSGSTDSNIGYSMYSTGAGAYRFYVGYGGTIFATSTTITAISDQRLKENVQDLDVGLDKIMALKPRKFDWKPGKGKDIKGDRGWIAQEFEQVFPDMVDQWIDPAPEGEEPYKAVNADLIPVLVKAIQELKADLDATKAELAALKGA